ncbi:MAG: hypothetical protein ACI9NC_001143 [Verrucomicrobiales bacterium]
MNPLPFYAAISFFVMALHGARGDELGAGDFNGKIKPVLQEHCFDCHNAKKHKGDINLEQFDSDLSMLKQHKLWKRVVEAVGNGDMPPDDDDFTPQHRESVVGGVTGVLALLDSGHPSLIDPGSSLVRRLSRSEYSFAMRDLTGLDMDFSKEVGMPEDSTGSNYANVAAALNLPPALLEKYFAAAELALTRLFGDPDLAWESAPDWARRPNERQVKEARARFFGDLAEDADRAGAAGFVTRFMRLAWRRPIEPAETDRLMAIYDTALAKDEPPRAALRKTLKPVFVAPDFIFRVEHDQDPVVGAAKVSDVELASRLSFFLWSSIPDEELLAAPLSEPEVLESQVKRMLADDRSKRLTDGFFLRWLEADKVTQARPSTEFFPTFNDQMKRTMLAEVVAFCDHLRTEDRPLLDLLSSDYTFVNSDLAKLYAIGGVDGKELLRVALKPEHHRGGVLGMGAVLAATSHTNRTSPTKRGDWVLGVILGNPPPPPPPDAGMFKDEDKNKKAPKDFREKLALHASDANCAGCHAKMDPLGFGLDNYNAIGEWRPTSAELNTSGVLPGGEKITGADGLRQILWARRDQFVRNLVGQMLRYALGRELKYFDEGQITHIQAAVAKDGTKFSAIVLAIAQSYPFQYRRNAELTTTKP